MTTPYERLMAELIPDGTFGGPRPHPPPTPQHAPRTEHTTDQDAARHAADLAAAIATYAVGHPRKSRRHLRAVPPAA